MTTHREMCDNEYKDLTKHQKVSRLNVRLPVIMANIEKKYPQLSVDVIPHNVVIKTNPALYNDSRCYDDEDDDDQMAVFIGTIRLDNIKLGEITVPYGLKCRDIRQDTYVFTGLPLTSTEMGKPKDITFYGEEEHLNDYLFKLIKKYDVDTRKINMDVQQMKQAWSDLNEFISQFVGFTIEPKYESGDEYLDLISGETFQKINYLIIKEKSRPLFKLERVDGDAFSLSRCDDLAPNDSKSITAYVEGMKHIIGYLIAQIKASHLIIPASTTPTDKNGPLSETRRWPDNDDKDSAKKIKKWWFWPI